MDEVLVAIGVHGHRQHVLNGEAVAAIGVGEIDRAHAIADGFICYGMGTVDLLARIVGEIA